MIAFLISSFRCAAFVAQLRHAIDHVDDEMEARGLVQHRQLQRRVDIALFLVAADVQVLVSLEAIRKPVNQPRIAVEVEDDRLVGGEQAVELALGRPVRMLGRGLQPEEIHDVDEPQLEIGHPLAQDGRRGQRLHGGDVAARGQDHVRLLAGIGARPRPDAEAFGAMNGCLVMVVNWRCFCLSATITLM